MAKNLLGGDERGRGREKRLSFGSGRGDGISQTTSRMKKTIKKKNYP